MVEMQTFEVCDNISGGEIIGTISASAPEGQVLTYRLTDNAGGLFEIDKDNGNISLASGKSLDYSMATQHTITVVVSNTVAVQDTSTANFQVNVNTSPSLPLLERTFTRGSDVSIGLSNQGGVVESVTPILGSLPRGLSNVLSDGQVFIQGRANSVTLVNFLFTNQEDNTIMNKVLGATEMVVEAANQCGMSRSSVNITVNPSSYTQGDFSPNVIAGSASNPPEQIFSATNIPFADSGTGTFEDPFIIALTKSSPNIHFTLDFAGAKAPDSGRYFYIFFDIPYNAVLFSVEKISDTDPLQALEVYGGNILESGSLRFSSFIPVGTRLINDTSLPETALLIIVEIRTTEHSDPITNLNTGQFSFGLDFSSSIATDL